MDDFLVTLEMIMHPMDFATCLISRLAQAFNAVPGWNKSETIDQEVVKMRGLIVLQHWAGTYGSALETDLDFSIRKVIIEGIDLIWQQSFTLSLSDQRFLIKIRRLFDARGEISTTSPEDYENDQNQDFNDESSVFDSERVYYSAEEDEGQDHQVFGDFRKWRKRMKMRLKSIFSNSPKRSPASSGFNSPQSSSSLLINSFSSDAEFSEELSTVLMTDRSRNLANILGILEWDLFKAIQRSELVSFPVARESPHNLVESCPNLQRAIEHFNSMCRWFVQLVVNQDDGEPLLLAKLIRLAVKCVLIHNYNSALQIILALQSPAISARKDLWMALPTWERRLAKDLAVFGSPVKNFKNVRKALDEVQKEEVPVIPFTGLFLSDLVFNYERRSETQSNSSKTIPFYKNHLAAKVVRQFLAFQNPRHRFEKVLNGKERQLYSYFADIGRLGGEFSM